MKTPAKHEMTRSARRQPGPVDVLKRIPAEVQRIMLAEGVAVAEEFVPSNDSGMDAAGVRSFLVSYQDALKKNTGKSRYVDRMTACREAR